MLPALQRLSYAGKHLDDAQRTLEHYGVDYWHAKFPHWPIKIRRRGWPARYGMHLHFNLPERHRSAHCSSSCRRPDPPPLLFLSPTD